MGVSKNKGTPKWMVDNGLTVSWVRNFQKPKTSYTEKLFARSTREVDTLARREGCPKPTQGQMR